MGRMGAGEQGTQTMRLEIPVWIFMHPTHPLPCSGCAATNHSHHSGANDAVYAQAMETALLFGQLRSSNVYLNQPDNYCELLLYQPRLCVCVTGIAPNAVFQGGQRTGIGKYRAARQTMAYQ